MDFVQIISLSRGVQPANLWHWNRTYFSCRLFAYVIQMGKRNFNLVCKQQERTENWLLISCYARQGEVTYCCDGLFSSDLDNIYEYF